MSRACMLALLPTSCPMSNCSEQSRRQPLVVAYRRVTRRRASPTQIGVLDFRILEQRLRRIGENDISAFHDVTTMTDLEGKPGILLPQPQSPEHSTPLRHHGYSATHQLVGRPAGDRDTFIKDLAMARRQHPAQGFERRGLARAVRANPADQFAAG